MEQNQLGTIMSAGEEDQGTQFSPTKIDCTGIIEDVITKTSEHHQKTMSQITTNLEVQRANIDTMVQSINNLAQLMSQSVAYNNLNTQNSVRLSQQQTNFNTPNGVQLDPETNLNASNEARLANQQNDFRVVVQGPIPPRNEDSLSLNASNIWFRNSQRSSRSSSPKHVGNDGENDPTLELPQYQDKEQELWQQGATEDYDDGSTIKYGAEVSSSIAGATKIYWEKPLKADVLTEKLESSLVPSNCNFLVPKRTNVEIWTIIAGALRTNDDKLRKIQEKSAASTTQILKAASELTRLYANEQTSEAVKGPLTMLKDGLSLAGKANQDLNQFRRELIEPSLPPKYKKLAKNVDNSASLLFGDSISERLDDLQKENKVKSLLTEKPYLKEGTYTKQPNYTQRKRPHNDAATGASNYKSSSKPQKRTHTQGQNYRKERPQQQHKSNRYQNRYKN